MTFLIIGTVLGILLGLRFKVFVLVPATLVVACAIIATGHGPQAIALTVLATAVLLQVSYIVGCVVRAHAGVYLQSRKILRYRLPRSNAA